MPWAASYPLEDSSTHEKGAIVYDVSTRVAPPASKSPGGGRLESATRAHAAPAGGGGSGAVIA